MNSAIMDYVKTHLDDINVITQSTNITGTLDTPYGKVVVKRQYLESDNLSPFWIRIKKLFSSDFTSQRAAMKDMCALLDNPHIPCVQLIGADEQARISVFSFMDGEGWEPDEFPESAAIARQVGALLGCVHSKTYDFCGLPGGEKVTDFPERLREYVLDKAEGRDELPEAVNYFLKNGLETAGYAMMMADFSANQYLFEGEKVTALVDLDAYVVGPIEWELELVEACISDMDAFKEGYAQYRPYPDMTNTRGLYDFVMN